MKKILSAAVSLLLIGTSYATSNITLPIPGDGAVHSNFGKLSVSLNLLPQGIQYDVTCHVTSDETKENVVINLAGNSMELYLNGKRLNTQGNLNPGNNEVKWARLATYSKDNVVSFMNLDDTYSVKVTDCVASPMIGFK